MPPRIAFCILLALGSSACSGEKADLNTVTLRDSAGIAIVRSARPAWTDRSAWRVVSEPAISIGAVEGEDEAYMLDRVVRTLLLSDRRIVLLNGSTQELRFFDTEGRHLYSVGRRGSGPGEFQFPARMYRMPGDSLFVVDPQVGRFSVLDATGRFVRSHTATAIPTGLLADGGLVMLGYADQQQATVTGYVRAPLNLRIFSVDGTRNDTVAVLPGSEEYRVEVEGGMANYDAPFAKRQVLYVAADRIYHGAGDTFEISVRREDGTLERLIRADIAPVRVTPTDIEAWKRGHLERVANNPRFRPAVEKLVNDVPVPSTMPAFSALYADTEGNLWVRRYAPMPNLATEWEVFDREGRWLGTVHLPERFEIMEIGADYVIGVARDELGVEYVRLHRIEKEES